MSLMPWFCSNVEPELDEIRIVLLGKPEVRKRAKETILGTETLEVSNPANSYPLGIKAWKGKRVVLFDTPGAFELDADRSRISPEIQDRLRLSRPGPHALLLVIQLGSFCEADQKAIAWIRKVFGQEASKCSIIIFTGMEDLGSRTLEEYLSHPNNKGLRNMIQECHGQYFGFGNRETRESQAEKLLLKVEEIVRNKQNKPLCLPKMAELPKDHLPKEIQDAEMKEEHEDFYSSDAKRANIGHVLPSVPGSIFPISKEPELRIVLLGKTGRGKSATGNTILGEDRFDARLELRSITESCQLEARMWKEKQVLIVDTPAIFDSDEFQNSDEMARCLHLCTPGPHALVLVAQLGQFTEEDYQVSKRIKKIFGPEAQKYTIIVFTHREDLRKVSVEEYISRLDNKHFQQLISACNGRYCAFNNNEIGEKREDQADELLSKIEKMVQENRDKPFCTAGTSDKDSKSLFKKIKGEKGEQKSQRMGNRGTVL